MIDKNLTSIVHWSSRLQKPPGDSLKLIHQIQLCPSLTQWRCLQRRSCWCLLADKLVWSWDTWQNQHPWQVSVWRSPCQATPLCCSQDDCTCEQHPTSTCRSLSCHTSCVLREEPKQQQLTHVKKMGMNTTCIELGFFPLVQWAAVRTKRLLTRDPPHQMNPEFLFTSPACQGYSFTSVSTPPTILWALLARPQVQSAGAERKRKK